MISDAIQIVGAMGEHLFVDGVEVHQLVTPARTMEQMKAPRHGIADPVVGGRAVQHRPFAACPKAFDDFVDRIVVRRLGIFVHVKTGEALHAS